MTFGNVFAIVITMPIKYNFSRNSGQSLFEVVVALGIAAVILTGVVGLTTSSIRNSTFSRNNSLAARYAQETIEWLRTERDSDWTTFANRSVGGAGQRWCLTANPISWPGTSGPCGASNVIAGTVFTRELTMTLGTNSIEASVVVSWTDSQGTHQVRNGTLFTNWRN
jgi:type II secretory pathway pseudopilin PulG